MTATTSSCTCGGKRFDLVSWTPDWGMRVRCKSCGREWTVKPDGQQDKTPKVAS